MKQQKYLPRHQGDLAHFLEIVFRYKKWIAYSFLSIFLVSAGAVLLLPDQYEAEIKILVTRGRVDPVVTPNAEDQARSQSTPSAQDVNSEVGLLQSTDLLQQVVIESGLADAKDKWWKRLLPKKSREQRIAECLQSLQNELVVTPPKMSNLITVSYTAADPQMAAKVMNILGRLYMEKHMSVHRPPGTYEFYNQQADRYQKELAEVEQRLVSFTSGKGVVSGQVERDNALQKLTQFEAEQQELQAAMHETEQRIRNLEAQASRTPARMRTQVRTLPDLAQQLRSALYNLELKRAELLQKYAPTYRAVTDIDGQIAKTKAAIAEAEKAPVQEETSDTNPTYGWIDSELAKARSELAGLAGKAAAVANSVRKYRAKAQMLDQNTMQQQELLRAQKTAQDNYMLYINKKEEAHIADELDRKRIANVALAEPAIVPRLPVSSKPMRLAMAGVLALLLSGGVAFGCNYLDPCFRSVEDVRELLNVRVVAQIPQGEHLLDASRPSLFHSSTDQTRSADGTESARATQPEEMP